MRNGAVGNEIVCSKHSTHASHKRAFLYGLFSLRLSIFLSAAPVSVRPRQGPGVSAVFAGGSLPNFARIQPHAICADQSREFTLMGGLAVLPRLLCLEPAVITHRAPYLLAGLMEEGMAKKFIRRRR